MRIPLERLIDGMVRVLRDDVTAQVSDRYARGQVWAVIDILSNLRDRTDWKASWLDDETTSTLQATADACVVLREAGLRGLVDGLPTVAADAASAERLTAAREALVALLDALGSAPPEVSERVRTLVGQHLAGNALRDLMVFKPSLLNEISKG